MTTDARCQGSRHTGASCDRPAGPSGWCMLHDPARAQERGRRGGVAKAAKERAERAAQAAAIRLETVAEIRALVLAAARMATVDGDTANMLRAAQIAADLIKTHDLEARVDALEARAGGGLPHERTVL